MDELVKLSKELDFVIFEDRKFADIGESCRAELRGVAYARVVTGRLAVVPLPSVMCPCVPDCHLPAGNTVSLQYSSGTHKIASWSDLTNAHPVPGPGIISGLSSVGAPLGRALILLAEMSSKGCLARGEYTKQAMAMARDARTGSDDFVVGFIAMSRVDQGEADDWLILTPGVGLVSKGDKMGQQYRTPREVVYESGCDVIIVGRGIYGIEGGEQAVKDEAERYREEGWKAYEERLKRAD